MADNTERLRKIAGWVKVFLGFSALSSGILVLFLNHPRVERFLDRLLEEDREAWPAFADLAGRLIDETAAHSLELAIVLIPVGLVQIAAALLFLARRTLGYWLLLGVTIAILPFESFLLVRVPGLFNLLGLVIDLLVIAFLLVRRRQLLASADKSGGGRPLR